MAERESGKSSPDTPISEGAQTESELGLKSPGIQTWVARTLTVKPFFSGETAGSLRLSLEARARAGPPQAETVDMPLSERAEWALQTAAEHAGMAEVQLLHVLWGLISDKESSVSTLLNVNGVTAEQVEDAIHSGK